MKSFPATLSSFAFFALAGCATLQVETDYAPGASLTPLSTYAWVDRAADADESGDPALDSPLLKRHIRDAVEGELGRMGYRKVAADIPEFRGEGEGGVGGTGYRKAAPSTPDLRISYRMTAERQTRVNGAYGYGSYGYGSYGYGPYGFGRPYGYPGRSFGFSRYGGRYFRPYYGYGGAGYGGTGRVRQSLEATLVLDIVDGQTEEVIFRGWARKSLHSHPSPEQVRTYVTEAVEEILEGFPPAG